MSLRVIHCLGGLLIAVTLIPAEGLTQPASERQACAAGEAQACCRAPLLARSGREGPPDSRGSRGPKGRAGGAYTTDLNADRLNIEVDRAGIVTGLRCG